MQYLRRILNQIDKVRDKEALDLLKKKYKNRLDDYIIAMNNVLKKWYDPKVSDSDYVIAMKKLRKEFDN